MHKNRIHNAYKPIYNKKYAAFMNTKSIKKQIRLIEKELAKLNFVQEELSNEVILNASKIFLFSSNKSILAEPVINSKTK